MMDDGLAGEILRALYRYGKQMFLREMVTATEEANIPAARVVEFVRSLVVADIQRRVPRRGRPFTPALTLKQQEVYTFLCTQMRLTGRVPTYRAIARQFGWSNRTTAYQHLSALERKGVIVRVRGRVIVP